MAEREYEKNKEKYEADIRRMVEGIDVESLQALSIQELKIRNAILHKIVQEAIISKDPRQEGLIAQQRAVNAVLVNKIGKRGKKAEPIKVKLSKIDLALEKKKLS